MEFAGRTQLPRIGREGESETTQARINQRCRSPLAAPEQEITAVAVGQITFRRITTEREKIDRMPLLPCATQTDAPWTFTCETETNTLVRAGQDLVPQAGVSLSGLAHKPRRHAGACEASGVKHVRGSGKRGRRARQILRD